MVKDTFNVSHHHSSGKYLGCPEFQGRSKKDMFQDLITRANKKLSSWKANVVSKAGQVTPILSNLESLPSHTTRCFQLPISITNILDKINREFLWKNLSSSKGFPLVA